MTPAFIQRIAGDSDVQALAHAVRHHRAPENPKGLPGPVVVVRSAHPGDKPGMHGVAVQFAFEVDVWGYDRDDNAMGPDCERIAQRIVEAMKGERIKVAGGGETSVVECGGWTDVRQPDARTIRIRAVYRGTYWSEQNIDALAGS